MQAFTKKRPSGALFVAVVALMFAVVGTAVAANDGSVFPKLTKSKVKQIAKKQATKQLKANVAMSHVNLADRASEAGTVGGLTPHKMFTKIATDTGATGVLSVNGLTLSVSCVGGALQLTATTNVENSIFASNVMNSGNPGGISTSDLDPSDQPLNVLQGLLRGEGTFTYSQPNGTYVSGTFTADNKLTFENFDGCVVVGTAFSG
jgi:hypothetical protein